MIKTFLLFFLLCAILPIFLHAQPQGIQWYSGNPTIGGACGQTAQTPVGWITPITGQAVTCQNGLWGRISASASTISCAGTPGNTTGVYLQQCQASSGSLFSCNNSSGCTVSADWISANRHQITLLIGGSPFTTGTKACTVVSIGGVIANAYLISDAVPTGANLALDVLTVPFSSYTGLASATSITASASPTITTAASSPSYSDSTLAGWTTPFANNTVFCLAVKTAPTGGATWAVLSLEVH